MLKARFERAHLLRWFFQRLPPTYEIIKAKIHRADYTYQPVRAHNVVAMKTVSSMSGIAPRSLTCPVANPAVRVLLLILTIAMLRLRADVLASVD
jgi:hypothetical protein